MHEDTRYLLSLIGMLTLVAGGLMLKAPAQLIEVCDEMTEECEFVEVFEEVNKVNGGSSEVWPNIGRCVLNESNNSWQCLRSHPAPNSSEATAFRSCEQNSANTAVGCLKEWAQSAGFQICGPVLPGTGSFFEPGSGEIEIPYQGNAARQLNRAEAHYQCTGERLVPRVGEGWSPYRFR